MPLSVIRNTSLGASKSTRAGIDSRIWYIPTAGRFTSEGEVRNMKPDLSASRTVTGTPSICEGKRPSAASWR